jgi:glutathionyl-hydroquinone reductase
MGIKADMKKFLENFSFPTVFKTYLEEQFNNTSSYVIIIIILNHYFLDTSDQLRYREERLKDEMKLYNETLSKKINNSLYLDEDAKESFEFLQETIKTLIG